MTHTAVLFQPWKCDACRARGDVEHLATEDAGSVLDAAQEQHMARSPECLGRVRFGEPRVAPE